ncbi:hypothetical protein FDP22_02100 [Paroceanicella profunda]|uniref:Uncharacterized protein n=1 Tax=Paroceanicella profunda TaxID=2579971 RepID=A0A5B8FWC9_9RHOB|nr:hypothetical protein FDP22_02100 [Paroceanicella profunda]
MCGDHGQRAANRAAPPPGKAPTPRDTGHSRIAQADPARRATLCRNTPSPPARACPRPADKDPGPPKPLASAPSRADAFSSGIRHQASGIRHQASGIRHQASGIRHQASGIRHQASGIRHQASGIRHQASGIRHQASGIRHQASGIRHQASGIRHQASGIRHQASGIRHQASGVPHGRLDGQPRRTGRSTVAGCAETRRWRRMRSIRPGPKGRTPPGGRITGALRLRISRATGPGGLPSCVDPPLAGRVSCGLGRAALARGRLSVEGRDFRRNPCGWAVSDA